MKEQDETPVHPMGWLQFKWLRDQGVTTQVLLSMIAIVVVRGVRTDDGFFAAQEDGRDFLAFYEEVSDDVIFWCPATGELATWCGRAFALGEENVSSAGTYAFDNSLHLYRDPLDWLRDRCRGIVVVRWDLAFDMLRDAPRVAVDESLLPLYQRHIQPPHLPELSVLVDQPERMAA